MPAWLNGLVRTGLQALWGYLVVWAVARDIPVPEQVPEAVQVFVLAAIAGVAAGIIQWAERRSAEGNALARVVRWLARLLMLGTRVATYPRREPEVVALLRGQQQRSQARGSNGV